MNREGYVIPSASPLRTNEVSFEEQSSFRRENPHFQPRLQPVQEALRDNNPNQQQHWLQNQINNRPSSTNAMTNSNILQNSFSQAHAGQFCLSENNPLDQVNRSQSQGPPLASVPQICQNRMLEPRARMDSFQSRPRFPLPTTDRFPCQSSNFENKSQTFQFQPQRFSVTNDVSCINAPQPHFPPSTQTPCNRSQVFQPPPRPIHPFNNEKMSGNPLQNVPTVHGNMTMQVTSSSSSYEDGHSRMLSVPMSSNVQNQFRPLSSADNTFTSMKQPDNPFIGDPFTAIPRSNLHCQVNEKSTAFSNFYKSEPVSHQLEVLTTQTSIAFASATDSFNDAHSLHAESMHSTRTQMKDENKNIQENDKLWIANWLHKKGKEQIVKTDTEKIQIRTVQAGIGHVMTCLAKLNNQKNVLADILSDTNDEKWNIEKKKLSVLEEELDKKMKIFEDSSVMKEIQKKLNRRKKKRERARRRRLEKSEQQKNALIKREELHKKIDSFRNQLIQENLDKIQAKELKKQADNIMGEVRKKLNETEKTLDMMKSLEKLRKIRKEAAQKRGLYSTLESDQIFCEKIEKTKEILLSQKKIYVDEEMTLKVMLETEQEESREKEKEKEKQRLEELEERHQKRLKKILFGEEEVIYPDDQKYSIVKFYEQAHESFESFLKIRQDWDAFIVPENTPGSSRIPLGFVVPVKPSNKIWKTALKKT